MRIAIMASGKGSNLKVILDHARAGRLDAEPCLVLCNNPEAGALAHAKAAGVPTWSKSHQGIARADFDAELLEAIGKSGAEAVILAGYMRLLSPQFIQAYAGRILNVHPSLLPSFPGVSGMREALDYRVRLAGCTVHFVEEEMDSGSIIIQAALPVSQDDTLETLMPRVHALEHRIYPQAIQWLAQGRLRQEGRIVWLLPGKGAQPANGHCPEHARDGGGQQTGAAGAPQFIASPPLEDF